MALIRVKAASDEETPKSERYIDTNEELQDDSNEQSLFDAQSMCQTEMNFDRNANKSNLQRGKSIASAMEQNNSMQSKLPKFKQL